jgi:hypothetical protein
MGKTRAASYWSRIRRMSVHIRVDHIEFHMLREKGLDPMIRQ